MFDDQFDLSPKEAQVSILKVCDDLRNQTFVASGQVTCWIEEFNDYIKDKYKKTINKKRYNPITLEIEDFPSTIYEKQLPLSPEEFNSEINAFSITVRGT